MWTNKKTKNSEGKFDAKLLADYIISKNTFRVNKYTGNVVMWLMTGYDKDFKREIDNICIRLGCIDDVMHNEVYNIIIARKDQFDEIEKESKYRDENGNFKVMEMVNDILPKLCMCTIGYDETLYVWDRRVYRSKTARNIIDDACQWLAGYRNTNKKERDEVYKELKAVVTLYHHFHEPDMGKVAFQNGVLDVDEMKFYTEDTEKFAVINKRTGYYPYSEYEYPHEGGKNNEQ